MTQVFLDSVLCSSQVAREQAKEAVNPANFGDAWKTRLCICEVPGQVPCPKHVPIPNVKHSWHEKGNTTETSDSSV